MSTEILRLILLHSSLEEAEHLLSLLRNAGIAVRPERAEDLEDVQELLQAKPCDLIFHQYGNEECGLEQLLAYLAENNRDLPVLSVSPDLSMERMLEVMRQGAAALVSAEEPEFLELMVRRQMEALSCRRQVRRLETLYRESEKRNHALLDSSRDAIAYVHEGAHVFANKAYLDMFQFQDSEEIEGLPVLEMIAPSDQEAFKKLLRKLSRGKEIEQDVEYTAQRANGEQFKVMLNFSSATINGEPCHQIVFREASFNPELEQELEQLKSQDLLTGLLNKDAFNLRLEQAVKKAQQGQSQQQFLVYLELDHFKDLSDQIGISGTDLLLRDVADLLKESCPEARALARIRDQIFTLMLELPQKEVEKRCTELSKKMERHLFEVGQQSVNLTVSIGVVVIGEGSVSPESLLTLAAETAGEQRADGGNGVRFYKPKASRDDEQDGMHWVHLIKDAMKKNRFMLARQNIQSLHGGDGEYYEVLLRMKGPKDEEIVASHFLPWAEKHGLMKEIDRWVIQRAVKELAQAQKQGQKLHLFVNVSVDTLSDASVLPWLAKLLKAERVRGDSLIFEVPESMVVTHMKPARRFHRGLKQLHCGMALEQFGLGLNSFQILKHLPADYLKIDRSLMEGLSHNEENQAKVEEITKKAHAAGKLVIAEFVEDSLSLSVLWNMGVNFAQGNFIHEPALELTGY